MARWYAMSTRFSADPKIEALGEKYGPGGPFAIVCLFGQAKLQEDAGRVQASLRTLAHESFVDRADIARILEDAAETGLLDIEELDDSSVTVRFPAWTRWQDAGRKAADRAARKATSKADVRTCPDVSGGVPTDRQDKTDKDKQNREVGRADAPLSHLLADLIEGNGARRPRVGQKWADAERLMGDRDRRTRDEAERLIRWCQAEPFWHTVILSMPKFREKYDQMLLQARQGGRSETKRSPAEKRADEVRRKREARAAV